MDQGMTVPGQAESCSHLADSGQAGGPRGRGGELRARDDDAREVADLRAQALLSLRGVAYLGGYVPESVITPGSLYDSRADPGP